LLIKNKMGQAVVTGLGIVSALGLGVSEQLKHLRLGATGIGKAQFFDSKFTQTHDFAELGISTPELLTFCGLETIKSYCRTDALAFAAFNEAIKDAFISKEEIISQDTAFISASTVGGMVAHKALYDDAHGEAIASDFLYAYPFSAHTYNIINAYGIKGYTNTLNTACSSSANAIIMGAMLIKSKRVKRAIVGGVDSLSKFTVNGFNALRILSERACKPFDVNRTGLTLGEGAAYLVLEDSDFVQNKKVYAALSGYGNANDAYHPSALSDDAIGVSLSMEKALKNASLNSSAIDYVNTHGTGTDNNDSVEMLGLQNVFSNIPPFNATKVYTGHTLGAAGAIEAILTVLSIHNQELYQSLHCTEPISIAPIQSYQNNIRIQHAMSNSFGFGGQCSSLIFSKI